MPDAIKIFHESETEYIRLKNAAAEITKRCGAETRVGDTMFDAGSGLKWTTILARPAGTPDWIQILSPALQARVAYGDPFDANVAIREAVETLNRLRQDNIVRPALLDPDDKAAMVREIARLTARIPAAKDVTIQYGMVTAEGFVPLESRDKRLGGGEAVRFVMPGQDPEDGEIQSIAGDSLLAVLDDVVRMLTKKLY